MSGVLTCPSCGAENAQRISALVEQQTSTGSQSKLAGQYNPPKHPWAYLHGFLLGIPVYTVLMLSMTSPEASEMNTAIADIVSSVALLGVWIGFGAWKTKTYRKKLDEWERAIASKVLCLQCGHTFNA
jgi:ribosomal protein L37AE/L43A